MKLRTLLSSVALLSLIAGALTVREAPAQPGKAQEAMVFALQGVDQGTPRRIDTPEGAVEALCFQADIVDISTGQVIGTGFDCLANVVPNSSGGVSLTDYTIFQFPEGTIAAKANVSVEATTLNYPGVTHVTGSFPTEGENNILWGSGAYKGATGSVRLSGGVDMSKLGTEGEIQFDCIFVVELD